MANKIKEYLKKIPKPKNKRQAIIILGIVGIILILLSEIIPSSSSSSSNKSNDLTTDYDSYVTNLEEKTTDIISSINGVGKCKVMITLNETDENVYAKNSDESSSDSSYSKKDEYVLYEDNNDDTPVLLKQYFPKVSGVVVVCQGGDDIQIKEQIISSISSLYGISSTKISVSKLK